MRDSEHTGAGADERGEEEWEEEWAGSGEDWEVVASCGAEARGECLC